MIHLVRRYFEFARESGHVSAARTAGRWLQHAWARHRRSIATGALLSRRSRSRAATAPAPPGPLRVLILCHDYPQLSESYIHAEIRWMLLQGVAIEVFVTRPPLAPGEAMVPIHKGSLEDCVASFHPDIIHVHWLSKAWDYADQLNRFDLPVTIRCHGFDHSESLMQRLLRFEWIKRLYLLPGLESIPHTGSRFASQAATVDTSRYYPQNDRDPRLVLRAGACLPTKDLELFVDVAAMRTEYRFVLALATNHAGAKIARSICAHNEALGAPVNIRFDVPYDEMGRLMRQASVYLHTFGYRQPFGQPISIAEAMACGTIVLLRDSERARAYAGDAGLYYRDAADASARLLELLELDVASVADLRERGVERARLQHLDDVTMPALLADWRTLCARPLEATA